MFRPNLPIFFVEFASNRGSRRPDRRILAKNAGSTAIGCKDMIANVRKRKELKMLYVRRMTLIPFLAARALHFIDITKCDIDAVSKELKSSVRPTSIYMPLRYPTDLYDT